MEHNTNREIPKQIKADTLLRVLDIASEFGNRHCNGMSRGQTGIQPVENACQALPNNQPGNPGWIHRSARSGEQLEPWK